MALAIADKFVAAAPVESLTNTVMLPLPSTEAVGAAVVTVADSVIVTVLPLALVPAAAEVMVITAELASRPPDGAVVTRAAVEAAWSTKGLVPTVPVKAVPALVPATMSVTSVAPSAVVTVTASVLVAAV